MMANSKTLITYFSRTGNTKVVAEMINERVGGDLIPIQTQDPEPTDYRKQVDTNMQEELNNVLPELKTVIPNFHEYDRIFIGTPTWNMSLPQAVVAFLNRYDFSGKTVIPFNTHGPYGAGSTFSQIKAASDGAEVLEGLDLRGGEENVGILLAIKGNNKVQASKQVDDWLRKIGQLQK